MNLIGKIFVVLIFVMSLVFMTCALMVYSAHINWREVVENTQAKPDKPLGLRLQVQNLRKDNDALKAQLDELTKKLDAEIADKRAQVAKLEQERDDLQRERDQLMAQVAQLTQQVRDAVAAMDAAHQTLAKRTEEVNNLRDLLRQAEQARHDALVRLVQRTDELHQAANELRALKDRAVTLAADLAKAKEVLTKFDLKAEPELYHEQAPPVEGVVMAVPGNNLVEISIGADDGLMKGHRLDVFRLGNGENKYLGRIEVIRTEPQRAVCQIVPEYQRGPIQEGDRVASKLR
jgi:ABC-type transporter Mla subunit MlaD